MRFFYTFHTAFEGLRRNRSRSALTVLGIVIGIAAVMLVMSIGSSAQNLILSQIQGLGTRTIAVIHGREPTGPSDAAQLFGDSEAMGKRVRIKDRALRVIGVLPTKGQVSFFNFDEAVFAPYTTAQQF